MIWASTACIPTIGVSQRADGESWAADIESRHGLRWDAAVRAQAVVVAALSPFCAQIGSTRPELLAELLTTDRLRQPDSVPRLRGELAQRARAAGSVAELKSVLRQFRYREALRIAWRDLAGLAPLDETLADLSRLADTLIGVALEELLARAPDGARLGRGVVVLGMGKLGGGELNFSSDVDLIFAADATDEPADSPLKERQLRLMQQLIDALSDRTAEGYVYRVDTRLRPFGSAGALLCGFSAMEEYYQLHGRDWERYALVKARAVAGDTAAGNSLLQRLRPFVYRKYLDYGALSAIREMKALINAETAHKGLQQNVKTGPGGIREIEFIGQAYQLIRGGQDAAYRQRGIRPILCLLAERGDLAPDEAADLLRAYEFLRHCENRLQMEHDEQVHKLPESEVSRARLAAAMGCADWTKFMAKLDRHRSRVQQLFDSVFGMAAAATAGAPSDESSALSELWLGRMTPERAARLWTEYGIECGEGLTSALAALRESRAYVGSSAAGRTRMDQFMPRLLKALLKDPQACEVYPRLLRFVETVAQRSVYLTLLMERPAALGLLIKLTAASPWIGDHLCRHPALLDELLDARVLFAPGDRSALAAQLLREVGEVALDDVELLMERLRRFKHAQVLRVAAADIMGRLPLMKISDHLSWIAEAVLDHAMLQAWRQLELRYGQPACRNERGIERTPGFAIVAYGKLGGLELGYGSDLDLVFLHDSAGEQQQTRGERSIDNGQFFARLAQRIVHLLTTVTPSGLAYPIDARLRPNGGAGLLVSSVAAYRHYQASEAWTWEHQALVRARFIAGPVELAAEFQRIRRDILSRPRERAALRQEVCDMRRRMVEQLASKDTGVFDLKQHRGGIADIEFMVQYMVLAHAHAHPELTEFTDNIRILGGLSRCGLLASADADRLAQCYRAYRGRVHRLALAQEDGKVPDSEFVDERAAVRGMWANIMAEDI